MGSPHTLCLPPISVSFCHTIVILLLVDRLTSIAASSTSARAQVRIMHIAFLVGKDPDVPIPAPPH